MIIGRNQIHIQHFEIVISTIDWQFAEGNDAGNNDRVNFNLIVGEPFIKAIVLVWMINIWDIELLIK